MDSGSAPLERRRIATFLGIVMGIAAVTGAAIAATGGLRNSPAIAQGVPVTLATVLIASVYMFSPTVANVATRLVTNEGWDDLLLRPHFRRSWRSYALAWLGTTVVIATGLGLYFAAFPSQFTAPEAGVPLLVASAVAGSVVNTFFAFGEEFGWRAYLLPKLLPLGRRIAVVGHGLVWGVWHWPVIAMGYNYGVDYPLFPWPGLATMTVATVGIGTFLAWVTVRSGSVWPAALGHGTLNAVGSLTVLFVAVDANALVSPIPVALVGMVPWLLLAAYLLGRGRWSWRADVSTGATRSSSVEDTSSPR